MANALERRIELRDDADTQVYLVQGLWLQRFQAPVAESVRSVLEGALHMANEGVPLPPLGFVADLGRLLVEPIRSCRAISLPPVPGFDPGIVRLYEDDVLGRLCLDAEFERIQDAVAALQPSDQPRALTFVAAALQRQVGWWGVELNPAIVRRLIEEPPGEVLAKGRESMTRDGWHPELRRWYAQAGPLWRRARRLISPEDLFELEQGTALKDLSFRWALRQVIQAVEALSGRLPHLRPRPLSGRRVVPAAARDEGRYPMGGYASITTRGSIESLVSSQLAYVEPELRPDLFDVKYTRDELLYFARDENQLLRPERTYVIALWPELTAARFKDPELPWQRTILLLASLVVVVRKLSDWLHTDALHFDIRYVDTGHSAALDLEEELLPRLLSQPISRGVVRLDRLPAAELVAHCTSLARTSLCHALMISTEDVQLPLRSAHLSRWRLDGPVPELGFDDGPLRAGAGNTPLDAWAGVVTRLLEHWC
ncbi:MAG: hypothetical protein NZ700_16735 [Gemmataceae bacterium]|nr:hypothetical protein [Gemmataceae bacterium]